MTRLLMTILSLIMMSSAGQSMDDKSVEELIWAKEEAIFEGRGRGDLSNYLNAASDNYLGWPSVFPKPAPLARLESDSTQSSALEGEKITLTRTGFTRNGNTAITYFLNHRTKLGKGMAPEGERDVNQYYENIHVWTLEDGEWRLIAGMARQVDGPKD